jgi:uracil-DNA glycosylase
LTTFCNFTHSQRAKTLLEYNGAEPPFACTLGPRNAKIALVGEAFGKEEAKVGRPFMGWSGQELTRMLNDAGIARKDCFITNVFQFQPPDNKLEHLQLGTVEAKKLNATGLPAMNKGHYLHPQFFPELARLKAELASVSPNIIIALGSTATWALMGVSGITAVRGTCAQGGMAFCAPGRKILPTFHPASVLRQWDQRVIVVADLMKALRESEFPDIRRPQREITIDPTLVEIEEFTSRKHQTLSVDIETAKGQITCIGFAPSPFESLVIPFVDWRRPSRSYWSAAWQEEKAWKLVSQLLEGPAEKLFQNGLYDLQWLAKMGFRVMNCKHDTMLLHHALFPEMPKSLGFLGSIYTNEASWKTLRKHKTEKLDMNKKDE